MVRDIQEYSKVLNNAIKSSSLSINYTFNAHLQGEVIAKKFYIDDEPHYEIHALGDHSYMDEGVLDNLLMGFTAIKHVLRTYHGDTKVCFPLGVNTVQNFEEFDVDTSLQVYSKYVEYRHNLLEIGKLFK